MRDTGLPDFRLLGGAQGFDLSLLFEARTLAFLLQFEGVFLDLQIAAPDLDHGRLFDIVAQLAAALDGLDQLGQSPRRRTGWPD